LKDPKGKEEKNKFHALAVYGLLGMKPLPYFDERACFVQLGRICRESSTSSRTKDFPDAITPYSQDSTVSVATRLWNGPSGVEIPTMGKEIF
jgi:hypothetical protein